MSREADKMRAHEEHRKMWRKARASEKKLTPKQRVLKKHPRAFANWYMDDGCRIEDGAGNLLGGGTAPKAAWADAARRLHAVDSSAKAK